VTRFAILASAVHDNELSHWEVIMRRSLTAIFAFAFAVACKDSTQPPLHLIENGSFETGDFTSWTTFDAPNSAGGFIVSADTIMPTSTLVVLEPPDSTYAAITDQGGGGTHVLYQDVSLPANRSAALHATIYLLNTATDYVIAATGGLAFDGGAANQQFRVDVMNPAAGVTDVGTGVLLNVYQTQPGDPLVSGYITLTADLTPLAGQTVRIRFAEVDNQNFFHAGVDAVDVVVN
jgi:hypothetical protein